MDNKHASKTFIETLRKVRGDWGQVKPYTRVERDRKKYTRKQKHKGRTEE